MSERQYGFRVGRGTTQAIINHCNYIYEMIDDNKVVFSMYLDFRKAFDSVDHSILLEKLHFYGVSGMAHKWFKSYLADRRQYVHISGTKSSLRMLSHSIPQGSNLGRLLFLIYINDLPNSSQFFNYVMFADDCTVACAVNRDELGSAHVTINSHLLCLYMNGLSLIKFALMLIKPNICCIPIEEG